MGLHPTDSLFAPPRLPVDAFLAWAKAQGAHKGYDVWAREVVAVCAQIGLDDAIVAFQGAWETDQFTSAYFDAGNTGGIGIYASGVPSPFTTKDYRLAAHIHVANLLTLLSKPLPAVVQDATSVPGVAAFFRRVAAAAADPKRPPVRTLADLCLPYKDSHGESQCTYACDDNYANGICGRANGSGVNVPDSGRGPIPPQPQPAPPPSGVAAVTLDPLNLRDAASTQGAVLTTLGDGAALTLTGPPANGWWPVWANGRAGYCAAGYVSGGAATAVTGWLAAITGGKGDIAQWFGNIPGVSPCGAGCYDYVTSYGMDPGAHGGIDVGLNEGTPLYAPAPGTVVCAGTGNGDACGAFPDDGGGSGRIELALAGGVRLIFGHTRTCRVALGATVATGQQVGTSGRAGTGGHVHVELRVPAPWLSEGLALADPWLYGQVGATPAPQPQPQPQPGPDPASAFGSATFGNVTYRYDPNGVISTLWLARAKQAGDYPALIAVAESPAPGGTSRFFVFRNGWVAWTQTDTAPAAWLGQAA